jgi:hypothetical protein
MGVKLGSLSRYGKVTDSERLEEGAEKIRPKGDEVS